MKKYIFTAIIISAFFTIAIFFIHYYLPSLFTYTTYDTALFPIEQHIDNAMMRDVYEFHISHPEFVRRPVTSFLIRTIHDFFSVSFVNAYIAVNFSLLFFSAMLIYMIALRYTKKYKDALLSIVLYFFSFSILFAFTAEMSTYDDIVQYVLLFFSIFCLQQKKFIFFSISFFLAVMTRETSLLLIPGFLVISFAYMPKTWKEVVYNKITIKTCLYSVMSVLLFVVWLVWFLKFHGQVSQVEQYLLHERFSHLHYNFQDFGFALHSLVSLCLVLGFQVFLIYEFVRYSSVSFVHKKYISAFILTLVINTLIVYASARAREARLFALPLLFVWPFLGYYASQVFAHTKKHIFLLSTYFKQYMLYSSMIVVRSIIFMFIAYLFCFYVYIPQSFWQLYNYFRMYVCMLFFFFIIYYAIQSLIFYYRSHERIHS